MKILLTVLVLSLLIPVYADIFDWSPTVGVKLTMPQKVSISLGISSIGWGSIWGSDSGFLFRVEPGLSGGKVLIGSRNAFSMILVPIMSFDICGSYLYTWNDPWSGLENDQSYLGVEVQGSAYLMIVSAGVYRHIAGGDADHDWIFSAGAGLGF